MKLPNRVAIVTGAGQGLGRAHALALAAAGTRVIVNDLGGTLDGSGGDLSPAEQVAESIRQAGGEAISNGASVTDEEAMNVLVEAAIQRWGRVDILVNNAGILRDKSFAKMSLDDFRAVLDVHLMGSVILSKAVWPHMKEQQYGRIVFTSSSSGLYGNFGQANYGAAKMALVGLMNVLHLEGDKYNIRVNCLAPAAGTRMTEGLIPPAAYDLLTPESISPGIVFLTGEDAPSKTILAAGGGSFATTRILESEGMYLEEANRTPEGIARHWDAIKSPDTESELDYGGLQTRKFAERAAAATGEEGA